MITLKKFVKTVVLLALLLIPVSFIVAVVWYFFSDVLLSQEVVFKNALRTTYLLLTGLVGLYQLYWLGRILLFIWAVSSKLNLPFKTIEEAVHVYELQDDKEPKDWTKDWVKESILIKRTAHKIANEVFKHMK